MPEGLRLALTTFAAVRLRPARIDRRTAGQAMAWAPVIGALLGGAAALVLLGGRWLFGHGTGGSLLAATLAVATLAWLTRGLHLDGLADTADGLGVADRARALAVMKEPQVGAFGLVAVVLVLLLQVAALAAATAAGRGAAALLVAVVTGRLAVTWGCVRGVPAARPDGLGAVVVGSVPRAAAAGLTAVAAGAALLGGWRLAVGVAVGLVVAWLLRRRAVARFGGITGDVLGATLEVATAAALLAAALR